MKPWWIIAGTAVGATVLVKTLQDHKDNWEGVIDIVNALPKHPTKPYPTRSKDQIQNIVIHHSAVGGNQSPFVVARFHVESSHLSSTGAPGIGYHFYILEDGTTYQTNYLNTVSWHVKNQNTACVGICLSGNFDVSRPTTAQQSSLRRLLKALKQALPQARIVGHRDLRPTSCPGKNFDIRSFQ